MTSPLRTAGFQPALRQRSLGQAQADAIQNRANANIRVTLSLSKGDARRARGCRQDAGGPKVRA
jgi:hypothetical protein